MKDLKEVRRGRIKEYADTHPGATYVPDCRKIWETPCDIALPCATQNEIDKTSAEALVKGGCTVVCEGANMPSTPEAIEVYLSNGVLYGPCLLYTSIQHPCLGKLHPFCGKTRGGYYGRRRAELWRHYGCIHSGRFV